MDIQNMYDNLLQEVYRDILQKERFAGKRGNFVQTENGLVRSVRFASWHEKDDTITFRISVEVRFEKEALLRIMPALMILTAMYCMAVTIADTKSQRWLYRMILFPIAELLVLTLLLALISAKVLAAGAAVKGVCIVLSGSGLVSLIIQIMILFMKGYNKRQERKIRWLH